MEGWGGGDMGRWGIGKNDAVWMQGCRDVWVY
jgi:hypothetical protein